MIFVSVPHAVLFGWPPAPPRQVPCCYGLPVIRVAVAVAVAIAVAALRGTLHHLHDHRWVASFVRT